MSISYTAQTVRKHDPDRFLLSLYAPAAAREALWALYAFNHEIAKTREVVTDTHLGLIRLQWWRDALNGFYNGQPPLKHQIVEPLCAAIKTHDLPRELFDNLIYAREFDLEDRPPASLEGMVNYADYTSTPLLRLSLMVLGAREEEPDIKNAATAYALTGLLRAVPFHLSRRRCYLPADMIPPVEELYEGQGLERLQHAVEKISAAALRDTGVHGGRFLRLHAKLARMYLGQLRRVDYNVFSPRLKAPPFLKELRLLF